LDKVDGCESSQKNTEYLNSLELAKEELSPCRPFKNASQAYIRQPFQTFGPRDCWCCKSTKRGFFGCSIVVPGPAVVEMTCKQPQKHQGGGLKLCACVSCASFDSA